MGTELLREFNCQRCNQIFYVCRCCYRGQSYCCDECREINQRESHQESQHLYRTSDNGRKKNREGSNRRRLNKTKKNKHNVKNVADVSSTPLPPSIIIIPPQHNMPPCCHKCGRTGRIVKEFPRREYGDNRKQPFSTPNRVFQ